MGKDHDSVPSRRSVFGNEVVAKGKAISHHAVKTGGHQARSDVFRPVLGGDSKGAFGGRMQILEDCGLLSPMDEFSGRNPVVMTLRLRSEHYELVGMRIEPQELRVA